MSYSRRQHCENSTADLRGGRNHLKTSQLSSIGHGKGREEEGSRGLADVDSQSTSFHKLGNEEFLASQKAVNLRHLAPSQ